MRLWRKADMRPACFPVTALKILLLGLTVYTVLGWPRGLGWDEMRNHLEVYYFLSMPYIVAYFTVVVTMLGCCIALFRLDEELYAVTLATTLSFSYTETTIFLALYYVDMSTDFPNKYLVREHKRPIFFSMVLRFLPLLLLTLQQKDIKFASYRKSLAGIVATYAIYAAIICLFRPDIDGYIGTLVSGAPTSYKIYLFIGLAYATSVFDVYLTSINRVNAANTIE